jgi:hypothetical protein
MSEALAAEPWAERARAWVRAGLGDEQHSFEALRHCLGLLWQTLLREEAEAIVAGSPGPEELARYREILARIAELKAARSSSTAA